MDHVEAVKRQVAEKYLLGELSEPETVEFEEHYFDCQECARDLETGALFVDNATAVFREMSPARAPAPPQAEPRRGILERLAELWRSPMAAAPACAAVVLTALSGYQGLVVIPGLKHTVAEYSTPRFVSEYPLFETTRGEGNVVSVPADALIFVLHIDQIWTGDFPRYRCELRNAAGGPPRTWEARRPRPAGRFRSSSLRERWEAENTPSP